MTFFTEADVEAALDAESVHLAELFEVDFASGVQRYTTELVSFTDLDGNKWTSKATPGGQEVLSVSGFKSSRDSLYANETTYTISSTDEAAADMFQNEPEVEYRGRAIKHMFQVFDHDSNPIGKPVSFPPAFMDQLSTSWALDGVSMSMKCEGFFAARNAPQYGYINDQSQKVLSPTDRGLERQHLANAETHYKWP